MVKDSTLLLHTLSDVRQRVNELNIEDCDDDQIRALLHEAQGLMMSLCAIANHRVPIAQFPNEILLLLFAHCVDAEMTAPTYFSSSSSQFQRKAVSAISGVCRRWRDVSLHASDLWRNIHVDRRRLHPDCISAHLIRSAQTPLHLDLMLKLPKVSHAARQTDDAYGPLAQASGRVEELFIEMIHETAVNEWRHAVLAHDAQFPALRSLTLIPRRDYMPAVFEPFFEGDLPALQHLTMHIYVAWPPGLFRGLTTLELAAHAPLLRPSLSALLDVLAASPDLTHMHIVDHGPTVDDCQGRRIELPQLATLDLLDCHTRLMLEHLVLPTKTQIRSIDIQGRVDRALLTGRGPGQMTNVLGDLPTDGGGLGPLIAAKYVTVEVNVGVLGVEVGAPGEGHVSMGETRAAAGWPDLASLAAYTLRNIVRHPLLQHLRTLVLSIASTSLISALLVVRIREALAMPQLRSFTTSGLPSSFVLDAIGRRAGSRLRYLTMKLRLPEDVETQEVNATRDETLEADNVDVVADGNPEISLPPRWQWLSKLQRFVAARLVAEEGHKKPHRLHLVTLEVVPPRAVSTHPTSLEIESWPPMHLWPLVEIEGVLRAIHALGTRVVLSAEAYGYSFDSKRDVARITRETSANPESSSVPMDEQATTYAASSITE
ncbi:hypothetical protein BD626DRAFT_59489 [Schizophyllum amplum]|uniref:F-box domain-containing protein n=1 Tax=Schizophyllum amplum TaxID=97359 RepID=A0A550CC84_9AGAR|nr:hypothetical protein BD626DRAFT_59489 [Auriculariopsis ampla]